MTRTERGRIFDVLHEGRWLRPAENKAWALGRSLERMTLWELFLKLPDGIAEKCVDGDSTIEQRFRGVPCRWRGPPGGQPRRGNCQPILKMIVFAKENI